MATTTPNFGWPVPTSTDLVKDGATAIEALGDSIDASLLDLKGGTTGQILTKASNTDMDFSWSAAASGGGMTLLSTTTLSGAGTTISSISQDYVNLQIFITGVNSATNGKYLEALPNSSTTLTDGNYFAPTSTGSGKTYDNVEGIQVELNYNNPMLNANTANSFNMTILNYSSTTHYKAIISSSSFITSGTDRKFENQSNYFNSTTAISSIQFRMHGSGVTTNFDGGTVLIYGVK
jgi:hypothetical protein